MTTLTKEHSWLLEHPEIEQSYAGEYVAIVGETVASHGTDLKVVLQAARKNGRPVIYKVPSSDKEIIV